MTRLLADLVILAAQEDESLLAYDWEIDRGEYIRLLRWYDETRDATALVEYVPSSSSATKDDSRLCLSSLLGRSCGG